MEYKGSSQERANKRYKEKVQQNDELRKKRNHQNTYRSVKSFIRNHVTIEELKEIEQTIKFRKQELKDKEKNNPIS